jgi:hypothetical protein
MSSSSIKITDKGRVMTITSCPIQSRKQKLEQLPPPPSQAKTIDVHVIDMKQTRLDILANWRAWTPSSIVTTFKRHYSNLRSAAAMLSLIKKQLRDLEDPPPEEFLDKLALSKKEYAEIRKLNVDTRGRGALDVVTISCADLVVLQALQYLTSSNPKLLFAGVMVVSGLRPVELAKIGQFRTKLNNAQEHQSFWTCQTRFAKRGHMKTQYNECRDRPLLAPAFLMERALVIIRKKWPCKHLSNREVSRKYSSQWQKVLTRAYPMLPGVTARLLRRFFAVYSYTYFGKSVFLAGSSQASLNGYASWVLGHTSLADEVLAYTSLIIRPAPKLKLFEVGKNLKVVAPKAATAPKPPPSKPNGPVVKQEMLAKSAPNLLGLPGAARGSLDRK